MQICIRKRIRIIDIFFSHICITLHGITEHFIQKSLKRPLFFVQKYSKHYLLKNVQNM